MRTRTLQRALSLAGRSSGGREGARAGKWGAIGGGQDGWVGGLGGRTRGRAGERLLLAHHVCPSSFTVQRVLDSTFPGGQAGGCGRGQAGGCAGASLRRGVRCGHVRGAPGRAGGLVGWWAGGRAGRRRRGWRSLRRSLLRSTAHCRRTTQSNVVLCASCYSPSPPSHRSALCGSCFARLPFPLRCRKSKSAAQPGSPTRIVSCVVPQVARLFLDIHIFT